MPNEPRQMRLRLTGQCPVALTPQRERELIEALSKMLLEVARASDARERAEEGRSDEQQGQ